SLIGVALGVFGVRLLTGWLISLGISPPWFSVRLSARPEVLLPIGIALVTGVLVALCGAVAAAWRAGKVRPAEALRGAAVDESGMAPARRLLGVGGIGVGVALVGWIVFARPGSVLVPNSYVPSLLAPVLVAALLAPVVVGPLTRLLMAPFGQGAVAML